VRGRPPGAYGVVEDAGSEVVVPEAAPEEAGLDIGSLGVAGAAGAGLTLIGAVAVEGVWRVIGTG